VGLDEVEKGTFLTVSASRSSSASQSLCRLRHLGCAGNERVVYINPFRITGDLALQVGGVSDETVKYGR
jgi:hypothetical protein